MNPNRQSNALRALGGLISANQSAAAGIALCVAALLGLAAANSSLAGAYAMLLDAKLTVTLNGAGIDKPLLMWINDGLMAVFFFLVGLEIKREVLTGELSDPRRIALPAAAAIGGMAVPAAFYAALNQGDPVALGGWAIPAATDIAFSLGVLALLGAAVPVALKVFLLTLAILDDLGAVVIIALFYTDKLAPSALGVALIFAAVLFALNRFGVRSRVPYALAGVGMWISVLESGVHATLAGVAIALFIPLAGRRECDPSPLESFEHDLKPWVAFLVVPVFAFANTGVSLEGAGIARLAEPVALGIVLGLAVGKPLGVLGFAWLSLKLGLARLPKGVDMWQLLGVAWLCGIGFTMSLFIGSLAFEDVEQAYATDVRVGILAGSLVSALAGYLVLRRALATRRGEKSTDQGELWSTVGPAATREVP